MKTAEEQIIDKTSVIQTCMAMVRAGYQQAADEVFTYLNERKVTPDFMDGIMRLLDPENKKAFVYEVFAKELEDLKKLAASQPSTTVDLFCMYCQAPFKGEEPKMCCSGKDCGCMGQPTEPVVCSKGCYEMLMNRHKPTITVNRQELEAVPLSPDSREERLFTLEEAKGIYKDGLVGGVTWTLGEDPNDVVKQYFKSKYNIELNR